MTAFTGGEKDVAMKKTKQGDGRSIKQSRTSSRSARPGKEKGITRMDYGSTHGYRAYIKFKGVEYQKFFADSGSPEKAQRRARHWRRLKLQTLQSEGAGDNPLKKTYSNNRSGITGVFFSDNNWQAAWVEKGIQRNRKFSVLAYGEREAKRLACRERALAEQRLYGEVAQPRLRRYV